MSGVLISNKTTAEEFRQRILNERDYQVSTISLSGETNLLFRANLQSTCEDGASVLAEYLEAAASNSEIIAGLGEGFDDIDNRYAGG